jgi:hypothetical protein
LRAQRTRHHQPEIVFRRVARERLRQHPGPVGLSERWMWAGLRHQVHADHEAARNDEARSR